VYVTRHCDRSTATFIPAFWRPILLLLLLLLLLLFGLWVIADRLEPYSLFSLPLHSINGNYDISVSLLLTYLLCPLSI
jgi:hypothetical protein